MVRGHEHTGDTNKKLQRRRDLHEKDIDHPGELMGEACLPTACLIPLVSLHDDHKSMPMGKTDAGTTSMTNVD